MADHKLRIILPYHNRKCSDLYQPLRELSIDERMVKTKARTLFRRIDLDTLSISIFMLAGPQHILGTVSRLMW